MAPREGRRRRLPWWPRREGVAILSDADLEALLPALEGFHARFARFFRRTEGRAFGRQYLIGLALPIERKNVENIAEQVGAPPRKLQEFLSDSPWDDEGCIGELQRFVGEQLGAPGGALVLDDTGFAKKGIHSAGVGRQYSGTLGRVDNCQVGVFMGYASAHGHTLVDRRLYLVEAWLADPAKRNSPRAAVPEDVGFRTKLELAAEMLTDAIERGHLPVGWVTADAAYGDSADLRALVASLGRWYCMEVSGTTTVWTTDPAWAVPPRAGRTGRPRTKLRSRPDAEPAQAVRDIVRSLPPDAWIRHRVTEGEKGPREYEFARLRIVERVHRTPGPEGWLMACRPVGSDPGAEIKCYLSNAPATIALAELAAVGCLRWTIEEDFELAKGEVGLDHYEVTKYRGWYHHITLSLLALAFLKAVQRDLPPPAEPGTPAAVQSIPIGTQPPTGCPRHNPVATDAAPGNGCVFNTADMVWRIFPGNYPGGITVQKGTVYMDPGIYWIGGGGVTVRGGGSTPNTAVLVSKATSDNTGYNPSGGVLIYNTQDPNPAVAAACVTAPTGNGCYGPIDLNGGASTLALVPYQFAPYQNMVIFMDRAAPLSATITLNGGDSNLSVSGTIYAPHTIVEMRGGASDTISAQLIVWNFQLNGNGASLTVNYDAGQLFHLSGTGLVQ